MEEKKHIFDNPRNVRRVIYLLVVVCVVLLLLDLFYTKQNTHYGIELTFGFYGLFGFVGCVFLVLAAKELRKVVMRKEDYYDR